MKAWANQAVHLTWPAPAAYRDFDVTGRAGHASDL